MTEYYIYLQYSIYYNATIRPLIDYGILVWSSCDKHCQINRVLKLQKGTARIILNSDCQGSSVKLFNQLKWIPFFEHAKLTKFCAVYKHLQGHVPTDLKPLKIT